MIQNVQIGDTISVRQWRNRPISYFNAIAISEVYWEDDLEFVDYKFEGYVHRAYWCDNINWEDDEI